MFLGAPDSAADRRQLDRERDCSVLYYYCGGNQCVLCSGLSRRTLLFSNCCAEMNAEEGQSFLKPCEPDCCLCPVS